MVDFLIPGNKVIDEISTVQKERQQYFNAARNFHYSYKVSTSQYDFYITGDYAKEIDINERIEFEVSLLFKEVNEYRLLSFEKSDTYSLRYISSLFIPLLVLITMAFAYFSKKKISTLIFVLQVLLLADLVFLIL
ncbi:hypothetical protein [Marivirga harenae]|uniref:hypothetical protein n=1 Tax=Marivirga harenae TaxID=2010992 RepID=UPI0026DFF7A0|nr:hypothetical protein [Marivirga harenae]WKV13023.1 hypothetical protein Q3Y49_04175 [Marivirga harenae]|tara:strand:+ start:153527 stop:153931 length:405 start_codon:yes stop_codon:yes gene_type:complete